MCVSTWLLNEQRVARFWLQKRAAASQEEVTVLDTDYADDMALTHWWTVQRMEFKKPLTFCASMLPKLPQQMYKGKLRLRLLPRTEQGIVNSKDHWYSKSVTSLISEWSSQVTDQCFWVLGFGLSSNSPDKSRVTGLLGNVLEVMGGRDKVPSLAQFQLFVETSKA